MIEFITAHPTLHTAIVYSVFCFMVSGGCMVGLHLLRVEH